jgi:two-component system phosphate regulon sensor histidine kinase PhoR
MISQIESELTHFSERDRGEIARLKESEKYRKEFLGNVSHELKTPLFTLQGYITTLLDGAIDDPAINVRYLERSEKAVDRMISIVTDLEEISKLELGNLQLKQERFDVAGLVREIVDDASIEADRQGVAIRVGNDPDAPQPPVWVTADRKYIGQVVTNLVMNSIKYGHPGGHTKISFVDMFDSVMIEVADDGIGIAAEDLPRVFERFYRTDKSRSREMGGTGLGLSITKHILEAHGRQITLRSQPEQGSTFSFTLSK